MHGQRYGRWIVLEIKGDRALAECDCGTIRETGARNLRRGMSRSCGCLLRELAAERVRTLKLTHGRQKSPEYAAWATMRARCSKPDHPQFHLFGGRGIRVCPSWDSFQPFWDHLGERPAGHHLARRNLDGDFTPENTFWSSRRQAHGRRDSSSYRSWSNMRARCDNPQNPNYSRYGGRGIKICERWRASFLNFLADMGEKPPGMTIERIDVNGDYEPSNCKWIANAEQASNRSDTILVESEWGTIPLKHFAARSGVSYDAIRTRVKLGQTPHAAVQALTASA